MDGANLNYAAELSGMMIQHAPKDAIGDSLKALARKVGELSDLASKPESSDKVRKELAATSLELHQVLGAHLSEIKNTNPDAFSHDTSIANLAVAYNMNANVLVDAIQSVGGDILPTLIEQYSERVKATATDFNRNPWSDANNDLAKMLYFANLKAEFDRVHGTEEEQKQWRTEILNELLSGNFEKKVEEMKKSPLYQNVCKQFRNAPWQECSDKDLKKSIDNAITETAEDEYHKAYGNFTYGVKDLPYEKARVIEVVNTIDTLRAIANSVGTNIEEREGLKNYDLDPVFDTMDIKKRAGLFGRMKDRAGDMYHKEQYKISIEERFRAREKEIIDACNKEFEDAEKNLTFPKEWMLPIRTIVNADLSIAEYNFRIRELRDTSRAGDIEKQKQIKEYENKVAGLKLKKASMLSQVETMAKLSGKDSYDVDHAIRAYRNAYNPKMSLADNANLSVKKARKFYDDLKKSGLEGIDDILLTIGREGIEYNSAIGIANNPERAKELRGRREAREEDYRKNHPTQYRPVQVDGKTVYIALSHEERKIKSNEIYRELKEKYKVTTENDDYFFNLELKQNDELEKEYEKPMPIEKPDRSALKMPVFESKTQTVIKEIDLKSVAVDSKVIMSALPGVLKDYRIPTGNGEPSLYIDNAVKYAEEHEKVYRGTPEYASILAELREIKKDINNGAEPEDIIKRSVAAISAMDQYIDRKHDERDKKGRESRNSTYRREAMEAARIMLNNIVDVYKYRNKLEDKDYAFNKAAADIENAKKLGGLAPDRLAPITYLLKEEPSVENYKKSLDLMKTYLLENVDKYKKEDSFYSFRLDEKDPNMVGRIPKDPEERLYKAVLNSFNNLQQSYLDYVQKNCPERLSEAVFEVTYYKPKIGGVDNINHKLGLSTPYRANNPEAILPEQKSNPRELKEEFDRHFKAFANYAKTEAIKEKLRLGNFGKGELLSENGKEQMVDAAVSSIFLDYYDKKVNPNPDPYEALRLDEERRQIVSVIRKSELLYRNLCEKMGNYFNLAGENGSFEEIINKANEKEATITAPNYFRIEVMPQAMAEAMGPVAKACQEMLLPGAEFHKEKFSKCIEELEFNLKIAKAMNISDAVDKKLNESVMENGTKGKTFAETLQNLKTAMQEKQVHKQVEPPKGIKL